MTDGEPEPPWWETVGLAKTPIDREAEWERSDWALGLAGKILQFAVDLFLARELNLEEAEMAATLSEAFRDLSKAWDEHDEIEIDEEIEEEEIEPRARKK